MVLISASILSADCANLAAEVKTLESSGVDMVHIDVMDGHFVPNLSFGPCIISSLRNYTKLPFDVHLMINQPQLSINDYARAGSDLITIHYESSQQISQSLAMIRNLGLKAGLSLMPSTPPEAVDAFIDQLDLILVMTVHPGFAGQNFMPCQLAKIRTLSAKISHSGRSIRLSADGGINQDTARDCILAGANILVSGNFILKAASYQAQINKLRPEYLELR